MVQVLLLRATHLILPAASAVAAWCPLPLLLEVVLLHLRTTTINIVRAAEVLLHALHCVLAAAQRLRHVDSRADGHVVGVLEDAASEAKIIFLQLKVLMSLDLATVL